METKNQPEALTSERSSVAPALATVTISGVHGDEQLKKRIQRKQDSADDQTMNGSNLGSSRQEQFNSHHGSMP